MAAKLTVKNVRGLVARVIRAVNREGFYPRSNVHLDMVLLALLSKSLIVSRATCKLVESGFYEEAFGLTRTLIDIFFTVRYIANLDSFERSDMFVEFYAKDYEGWVAVVQKYYPSAPPAPPSHHAEMLRLARRFKNPHKWTGLGDQTKRMASEASTVEKGPRGEPVTAEFDYEVLYKWTSHYVHPTVVSLGTHAVERRERFVVHSKKHGPFLKFKGLALFNVVAFLAKIIICSYRGLKEKIPTKISDELDRLLAAARPKSNRSGRAKRSR